MSTYRKLRTKLTVSTGLGLFGAILIIIGYLVMIFSFITNLGYGLYLWSTEVTLALALWTAFKSWIVTLVSGILTAFLGIIITAIAE